jgi:hypothetical protein
MVVLGAGAMTGTYFLAGFAGLSGAPSAHHEATKTTVPQAEAPAPPLVTKPPSPSVSHPVEVIPIQRPEMETAGQSPAEVPSRVEERDPKPSRAQCNRSACSKAYRSFHPEDCTYQPRNGPRRLCRQ